MLSPHVNFKCQGAHFIPSQNTARSITNKHHTKKSRNETSKKANSTKKLLAGLKTVMKIIDNKWPHTLLLPHLALPPGSNSFMITFRQIIVVHIILAAVWHAHTCMGNIRPQQTVFLPRTYHLLYIIPGSANNSACSSCAMTFYSASPAKNHHDSRTHTQTKLAAHKESNKTVGTASTRYRRYIW